MNETHIHLVINHLPVIGSFLGALVLLHGILTETVQTRMAAYFVLIISAFGAGLAYLTGEGAEDSVKHIEGVLKSRIHEHEEFALVALIALLILGAISILGIFFSFKKSPASVLVAKITFGVALVSFCLVARAAFLGGEIRHTELNPSTVITPAVGSETDKEIEND